jgi:putative ATPase
VSGIYQACFRHHPLTLYTPKPVGWETKIADRLARWKELKAQMRGGKAP